MRVAGYIPEEEFMSMSLAHFREYFESLKYHTADLAQEYKLQSFIDRTMKAKKKHGKYGMKYVIEDLSTFLTVDDIMYGKNNSKEDQEAKERLDRMTREQYGMSYEEYMTL